MSFCKISAMRIAVNIDGDGKSHERKTAFRGKVFEHDSLIVT